MENERDAQRAAGYRFHGDTYRHCALTRFYQTFGLLVPNYLERDEFFGSISLRLHRPVKPSVRRRVKRYTYHREDSEAQRERVSRAVRPNVLARPPARSLNQLPNPVEY